LASLGSRTCAYVIFVIFRTCFVNMFTMKIYSLSAWSLFSSYGERMKKGINICLGFVCQRGTFFAFTNSFCDTVWEKRVVQTDIFLGIIRFSDSVHRPVF
jgi:hypothetical protein